MPYKDIDKHARGEQRGPATLSTEEDGEEVWHEDALRARRAL